jgi:predicted alpha/beta-fold hydrolase
VTFRRERITTPDDDFLDLDWVVRIDARAIRDSCPLVVVLHGLEGSAQSDYALQLYRALAAEGIGAVGLNFRCCSGEPNRAARMYHSGETGDLAHVLSHVRTRYPKRALGAVGFSLGGNVLLKFLGEHGAGNSSRVPLEAAVSISVPFDLAAGATQLGRGVGRIYQWFFMRKLRRKIELKAARIRDRIDVQRATAATTFWEFDELATAPMHGFESAADYYGRSSSAQYLPAIRVATLVIHALDDPFLPRHAVPVDAGERNPWLDTVFTERGGHVGFVGGHPWAPVFWAERTAARYLAEKLGAGQ